MLKRLRFAKFRLFILALLLCLANVSYGASSGVGVGLNVVGAVVDPPTISVSVFNNQTIILSGATYPGAVVYIEINGGGGFNLIASSTPNGAGSWVYSSGVLAAGDYDVDAYAKFSGVDSARTTKEYFTVNEPIIPAPVVPEVVYISSGGAVPVSLIGLNAIRANVNLSVLGRYVIIAGDSFPQGDTNIKISNESGYIKDIKVAVNKSGTFFYTVNELKNGSYKISIVSSSGQVRTGNFLVNDENVSDAVLVPQGDQGATAATSGRGITGPGSKAGEVEVSLPGEVSEEEKPAGEVVASVKEKVIPKSENFLKRIIKKYLTKENIELFLYIFTPFSFLFVFLYAQKRKKEEGNKKDF